MLDKKLCITYRADFFFFFFQAKKIGSLFSLQYLDIKFNRMLPQAETDWNTVGCG